jgi:hypothetical protein
MTYLIRKFTCSKWDPKINRRKVQEILIPML